MSIEARPTAAYEPGELQPPTLAAIEPTAARRGAPADHLVHADCGEVPAAQLAAKRWSGMAWSRAGGSSRRLYHDISRGVFMIEGNREDRVKPRNVYARRGAPHASRLGSTPIGEVLLAGSSRALFRTMWVCAGRADQIPTRVIFSLREVAGDKHHRLRGAEDGGARVPQRVSTPRHAPLHRRTRDTSRGSIQCPYHAWTYGLHGRPLGAPHMDETPGFPKDDLPLTACLRDVWDGNVFMNLAEAPAPWLAQLGDSPSSSPWHRKDLRLGYRTVYAVRANWKFIVQNYKECLHCPNLHPALAKLSHYLSGENEPLKRNLHRRPHGSPSGRRNIFPPRNHPAGAVTGPVTRRSSPRLLLLPHPEHAPKLAPGLRDDPHAVANSGRTRRQCASGIFTTTEISPARLHPSDAYELWDMTNRQDWHVCELSQLGISVARLRTGPVLESRGPALCVRPDDCGAARTACKGLGCEGAKVPGA